MKKIEISALAGMIAAVIFAGAASFADNCDEITENVFRLHILANSDGEEDQLLKLKVRDAVLEESESLFSRSDSAESALRLAEENLPLLEEAARGTIRASGYDYPVSCKIEEMYFDRRVYDSVTMPEGVYKALRITIGEAEGKNWWCVMYPPLCLPAVTDVDEVLSDDSGLTPEEVDMLKNPDNYEIRFYFLELYHKIKNKLSE